MVLRVGSKALERLAGEQNGKRGNADVAELPRVAVVHDRSVRPRETHARPTHRRRARPRELELARHTQVGKKSEIRQKMPEQPLAAALHTGHATASERGES